MLLSMLKRRSEEGSEPFKSEMESIWGGCCGLGDPERDLQEGDLGAELGG